MNMTSCRPFVTSFVAAVVVSGLLLGRAHAQEPPSLSFPVKCSLGETCWIVQYPDVNPAAGQTKDHACGNATYDGHKGTDIALSGVSAMRKGVVVTAAAEGVVVGTRDGERDEYLKRVGKEAVKAKECGNGVRIDHGGGWFTQYCHMRQGSIAVTKGQPVRRGTMLGLVGLSGLADFPHLHIQVEKQNRIIDPYLGAEIANQCGPGKPMWGDPEPGILTYRPTAIYHAGFAGIEPKEDAVLDGLHEDDVLPVRSPVLTLWAEIFWVRQNDRVTVSILGPDGKSVVQRENTIDRSQARRYLYAGARVPGTFWPAGAYQGEVVLTREVGKGQPPERYVAKRSVTLR